MTQRYSKWEEETVINYNNEEKIAIIYTKDPVIMKRLEKRAIKYPDYYKCIKKTNFDATYECPKKLIDFKCPRILTDKQKEKLRNNLLKYHNNKKNL